MKRFLLAGLLFWLPVWATILVIRFILDLMDGTLAFLPKEWQPSYILGVDVPGFGLLLALAILLFTGLLVRNFIGDMFIDAWEHLLARIPIVRSIYYAFKQVTETLFSDQTKSFRNVFLLEYPRKGIWTVALQTGEAQTNYRPPKNNDSAKNNSDSDEEWLTVYVPTTPNPTSGFLLLVSRSNLIPLKVSIDDALKMVISLGVIQTIQPANTVNAD